MRFQERPKSEIVIIFLERLGKINREFRFVRSQSECPKRVNKLRDRAGFVDIINFISEAVIFLPINSSTPINYFFWQISPKESVCNGSRKFDQFMTLKRMLHFEGFKLYKNDGLHFIYVQFFNICVVFLFPINSVICYPYYLNSRKG